MNYRLIAVVILTAVVRCCCLEREAFTFTAYDLNVRVEPEQHRLGVRGAITLRNDSVSPQKHVVLQISTSLTWRSIQVDGKPVQFVSQPYTSDVDHTGELSEAIVTLPKDVPRGASVELTIGYEGFILLDATRLTRIGVPPRTAVHSDWDQIAKSFTAVRGVGYATWYPVAMEAGNLSEGNELFGTLGRWKAKEKDARMRIRLEYASRSDDTVSIPQIFCIGRGDLHAPGGESSSSQATECRYEPLGMLVPGFVAANYEILDRPNVAVAYRPENRANAEKFAQAGEAVAPFVKEWFGTTSEKAYVVDLFDGEASPFESGAMLLSPLHDADSKLLEIALVHELVHAVLPASRPWIFEGVAHFAQAVFRGQQDGRSAALELLALHESAIVEAERPVAGQSQDSRAVDESLISTSIDEFNRSKAAYVWWMLRDILGDDVLKKSLSTYRPTANKDPTYPQHLLEGQSKRDLQWFFNDWVYHDRGLPDFRVESAYPRQASQGNYLVTVTVENLGNAGAEVPVIARFEGGEMTQRVEIRAKAKAVVRVATPKMPTEIVVNDGSVPESDSTNNALKLESPAK